jgi:hypothetical protein
MMESVQALSTAPDPLERDTVRAWSRWMTAVERRRGSRFPRRALRPGRCDPSLPPRSRQGTWCLLEQANRILSVETYTY